ncbi:hypothetical protein [Haematospirillum sp. H1815]|uniref:hypothetical protein n=1 Tax=Haematospirillum sp. H1815 TaxID=2723108 RepID=UPI001ADE877E|nr:hypothetical protein [Haematospirillum sp. H1815]
MRKSTLACMLGFRLMFSWRPVLTLSLIMLLVSGCVQSPESDVADTSAPVLEKRYFGAPSALHVSQDGEAKVPVGAPHDASSLPFVDFSAPEPRPSPRLAEGDHSSVADFLSRPPTVPPNSGNGQNIDSNARCPVAIEGALDAVSGYLALPPSRFDERAWVEHALRATAFAVHACEGTRGEPIATYWRATSFFLHGQYPRAALYFRRVAQSRSVLNAHGYPLALAVLLETCQADREGLDAYRLAGLHETAGLWHSAAGLYRQATSGSCRLLVERAETRLVALGDHAKSFAQH